TFCRRLLATITDLDDRRLPSVLRRLLTSAGPQVRVVPDRRLYRMAQPLGGNLDDATLLVVVGFEPVHQDLFVRPAKDPVVALEARIPERVYSEVAEARLREVFSALTGNGGNNFG